MKITSCCISRAIRKYRRTWQYGRLLLKSVSFCSSYYGSKLAILYATYNDTVSFCTGQTCQVSLISSETHSFHNSWNTDLTHVVLNTISTHYIAHMVPSASRTGTLETDEGSSGTLETEGFPLLLIIVIPLAAGLLILMVAVILALAVVIHLHNRNVYRSKYIYSTAACYTWCDFLSDTTSWAVNNSGKETSMAATVFKDGWLGSTSYVLWLSTLDNIYKGLHSHSSVVSPWALHVILLSSLLKCHRLIDQVSCDFLLGNR